MYLFKLLVCFWGIFFYILMACPSALSPILTPPVFCSTTSTPPFFLFRKGQASNGYQLNMTYQISANLGTSTCIKAGKAAHYGTKNPEGEGMNQTDPIPTVRTPTRRASYTTVTHMQRA